jgi:hypothetical protein
MHFVAPEIRDGNKNLVRAALSQVILGSGGGASNAALAAGYTDFSTFRINLSGNGQLWVSVHTAALGAAALTGVTLVVEFGDPDWGLWLPSREGVSRDTTLTANEWTLLGVGNWLVASRAEHKHFQSARVRFRAAGGAADAATLIRVGWHHDGLRPWVPEQ